jgi:hypothetical protein
MNEQQIVKPSRELVRRSRPVGIIVAAAFTVTAGLAEVVTGFTHTFFGITTSSVAIFTYTSAGIGLCYLAAGLLILTMKRWAAVLALVLLGADIIGRMVLVFTGLYPTDSLKNTFSVIAGTVLVALVALYIVWKWKSFR